MANGAVYTGDGAAVHLHDRKLNALEDLIEATSGGPVLIACWYKYDHKRIRDRFDVRKLNTSQDIADWNTGRIPAAVIHSTSAGHDLNLQADGSTLI